MNIQIRKSTVAVDKVKDVIVKGDVKDFKLSKEKYGKLHKKLIEAGIIDGSADTIVADLLDMKTSEIVPSLVSTLKTFSDVDKAKSLVYIALGSSLGSLITSALKLQLKVYRKKVVKAWNECDYDFAKSFLRSKKYKISDLNETQLKQALYSRLTAVTKVLKLRGDHFLKRYYYVSPAYKILFEKSFK